MHVSKHWSFCKDSQDGHMDHQNFENIKEARDMLSLKILEILVAQKLQSKINGQMFARGCPIS